MSLKVAIVTATRAEYGLLYPLIKAMNNDKYFDLDVIVTGTHLSEFYGHTVDKIIDDGINIKYKVNIRVDENSENGICNSISLGIGEFSKIFSENNYDLVVVLGDRYELYSVCVPALIYKIPIAHIHGGESTVGAIDEYVRHSITKMSSMHFPSTEGYAKRIIQMGENPCNVYNVGALGIDNVINMKLMDIAELQSFTGVDFTKDIALMTYHPVTLNDKEDSLDEIIEILESLLQTNLFTLITMPNADLGGKVIYEQIIKYIKSHPLKFKLVKSLGQRGYLSAMKYSKLMIGNSSSGIIESASFKLPTINIGDRQSGRFKPKNVIDCCCTREKIIDAVNKANSIEFKESISDLQNPYGDGKTASRIIKVLKNVNFEDKSKILRKAFYDLR